MKREIVKIDEEKCNGCGLCIPNCAEGALQIVDGKARLVSDRYCDGLGACLGHCPQDAIQIIEREADEFDQEAVEERLAEQEQPDQAPAAEPQGHAHAHHGGGGGCPGMAMVSDLFGEQNEEPVGNLAEDEQPSALSQWPVQLKLVPVDAPYFDGADLLLAADCVPFAVANFHGQFLQDKKLLVGCPKLDDAQFYAEKLTEILRRNDINSLTIVHMEVPCCGGLVTVADRALAASGEAINVEDVTVSIRGRVKSRKQRPAGQAVR
jgi:Pyruvate/2-oxoacid:ferredoxin oxidoreductase delta subunit